MNSRIHVVEEFNQNIYNIIIASDEHEVVGPVSSRRTNAAEETDGQDASLDPEASAPKKRKRSKKDREYGISRGIDFQHVACVLNFDLPLSAKSYTHRIGRTGRAGRAGMALSFVVPRVLYRKHRPTSIRSCQHDETVLAEIRSQQEKKDREVLDYKFDIAQVDAFRYRKNDALSEVTGNADREAPTRELLQALVNSEKLKQHFEENPDDLHHLRHDGELRTARTQAHLKHVPEYLLPNRDPTSGAAAGKKGFVGFAGFHKASENRTRKQFEKGHSKSRGVKVSSKKRNPLKTFSSKGRAKRK